MGTLTGTSSSRAARLAADPDRQAWLDVLAHLRSHQPSLCRQWFEEIEALGVGGGALNLRAQTTIHRDYLRRSCAEPFNEALQAVTGRLIPVRFLGPDDAAIPARKSEPVLARGDGTPAAAASIQVAPVSPTLRRDDGLVINPDYNFDNFVVGPGNRLGHAAATAVGGSPGRAYNPLFIHGGVGLGKTHLLQAVCLRILENRPQSVVYYLSCEGFITQFMESVQSGEMTQFRHRFRDVDVLVIDDIHFLAKRDRTQEEFFHTFNSLYQANKQIVLSSDAPPEEIPDLEERLVSRFKWGLVAKIEPPCYETRVAILKTKARVRGIELADDVACYVAARIDTNIRELEGAVTKMQIQAKVDQRPIDLDLAKAALGDSGNSVSSAPTIQAIIGAVTEFYRIRLTDLQSKHRPRSIALPRQVCMYLARRHTRHSLEEIGGYFGGRDHTTVMHAVRQIETRRKAAADFDIVIRSLEDKLRLTRSEPSRT